MTSTERAIQFVVFIEERLATGEGGAGTIHISWDDATRDYIISQQRFDQFRTNEILGCSKYLESAIELAITGKVYDE